MESDTLPWIETQKIAACVLHSIAVACTAFRLAYRWVTTGFWWEDGWAAFALAADMLCFVSAWIDPSDTAADEGTIMDAAADWTAALGFPLVLWACRIGILLSIVRIAIPSPRFCRIASAICCSFILTCAGLAGQKIEMCLKDDCKITPPVGVSQLVTDVISDGVLVILPIYFLSRRITRRQRILMYSSLAASLLISGVAILHSVFILTMSSGILVVGHIKTAVSLIAYNFPMLTTFTHRVCCRGGVDLDTPEEMDSLTSVNLSVGFTESDTDKRTTASERPPSTTISVAVEVVTNSDSLPSQ